IDADAGDASARAALSSPPRTAPIGAVFARVAQTPAAVSPQAGSASEGFLSGILLALGQSSNPVLPAGATVPAAAPARPDRDASGIVVPGLLPPGLRLEIGGGDAVLPSEETQDSEQTEWLAPWAAPGDTLDARMRFGVPAGRRACDACFADGSWQLDPGKADRDAPAVDDSGTAPDSATAAVAFAVVLGSYWGADRRESERRARRRFLN